MRSTRRRLRRRTRIWRRCWITWRGKSPCSVPRRLLPFRRWLLPFRRRLLPLRRRFLAFGFRRRGLGWGDAHQHVLRDRRRGFGGVPEDSADRFTDHAADQILAAEVDRRAAVHFGPANLRRFHLHPQRLAGESAV